MRVKQQIDRGQLVCPRTRQRLVFRGDDRWLESADGTAKYTLLNGAVPILLADERWAAEYARSSENMMREYEPAHLDRRRSLFGRIKSTLTRDYRTESSVKAFQRVFSGLPDDALCLAVGGGPSRAHPRLTNLNIGPFPNVDVVADAHCLPYSDACADVMAAEAVLEHLQDPAAAAREMHRVLKRGGRAYICTPFLQPYHGYPHHYQNYSLTGHRRLFETAGFRIVEAGVCVGPVYTAVSVIGVFLNEYCPYPLNRILKLAWEGVCAPLRPLDKILAKRKNAHVLASTTYVVAEKVL